jgi:membrane fusion protein, macrolide-specific efflux system
VIAIVKKNWKWILVALLALGGVAAALVFWRSGGEAEPAFREVAVGRGDIEATILSTGVVQPQNRLEIKPPIAGRADEVLVAEGRAVKKGQILAWMSSTERAALIDAARARGPEELKRWEDLYRPTPVLAPISGVIILRSIEPGQTFTGADAVLVMSDRLIVKAQVDETDIAQIKLKQRAQIVLDSYPDQPLFGYVVQIAYDAKTVNNVTTYDVEILPEKVPAFMRSGMTANVSFVTSTRKDVLVVPVEAIKMRDGRAVVTLVSADQGGKPREQEIRAGLSDGKRTEVIDGVDEGSRLLVARIRVGGTNAGTSPFSPMGTRRPSSGGSAPAR